MIRRRPADPAREQAVERLRWAIQIALHRAAGGKPIRRRLGRLTVNRVADLAHERGYELRLTIRPREDRPR